MRDSEFEKRFERPADTFFPDRLAALRDKRCLKPDIGCGKSLPEERPFRNEQSRKEYLISRLCQKCQDKVFGEGR